MTHDIVVCGAGLAGSAVARRLAAGGARIALVGTESRPGCEGLSARSRALLVEEGLDASSGCIKGPFARRGVWGEGRALAGSESLVERSYLAKALCERAQAAGADYRHDVVTHTAREGNRWRLALQSGEVLEAPTLIEARGRRGVARCGPLLLAIGQRFRRATNGHCGTGIGVTDSGWCWWAEQGPMIWVQVIGRPRSAHPSRWIAATAARLPALKAALEGAEPDGAPVARPAHARLGVEEDDPSRWSVGDAALALDPLSGQGVYEALRGARLVAAAIQSAGDARRAMLAQRFVAQRYREAWSRAVRTAAELYRENGPRGEFWTRTAAAYDALPAGGMLT
jgi:2-polyprenyl-6-methoxyphenol hydroxylase-like FAD-dependent oxidoreductase